MTSITCNREELLSALGAVEPVVPKKSTKTVLQNVLLEFRDGVCSLCATDQEIQIRRALIKVTAEGKIRAMLPGRVRQILSEVKAESVTLEVEEGRAIISAGMSEFTLALESPDEFPGIEIATPENFLQIKSSVLKLAIRRTLFAIDPESTRYALAGVLFDVRDTPTLVATDSRRLAIMPISCGESGAVDKSTAYIVPAKALGVLDRCLGDNDDLVDVSFKAGVATFSLSGTLLTTRLLEGRFPNWRDVCPKSSRLDASFIAGPFHSTVRQAQIVTSEESRGIDFTFTENNVRLTGQTAALGSAKVEQPVNYAGEKITITFDPRFVADFLKVLKPEEKVTLSMTDCESASVLGTDDGYRNVIMPLTRDR